MQVPVAASNPVRALLSHAGIKDMMDQDSRRLLDYARVSFDRLLQRRLMFIGGTLIAIAYLNWMVALVGFIFCYCLDYAEMKASAATLKARDTLASESKLQQQLLKRLLLTGSASTFAVVLFDVGTSLTAPEELRFIPILFLISAALYWAVSQHQIKCIVKARTVILASGALVVAMAPLMMTLPPIASPLWPNALTTACCFYFIHICARAYAANYDVALRQITSIELALIETERSARQRSDLLRILSHELRTPLNGIMGMAGVMELGSLSHLQSEQLATIKASGTRLNGLLTQVMDSELLNSGRLRIIKHPTQMATILHPLFARHGDAAKAKGLKFEVEGISDLPGCVVVDGERLAQCLDNLVGNAIKFTDEGKVSVSCVHHMEPGPPRLIFKIKDTGIGMSDETMARLFQRFSQEDMSESRVYSGMGLSLWICKGAAELMGGDLTAESKPGVGSTFILNLIAEETMDEAPAEDELPDRPGHTIDLAP